MMKKYLVLAFVVVVILAAIMLPVEQILFALQDWSRQAGPMAYIALGLLFALAIVVLFPTSPFMMLAGFLFGTPMGLAVTWLGGLLGSTIAYWLGRTAARGWIERRMRRQLIFLAIDRAIQRKGFQVVLLTRLVMIIPYPLLNYGLALTAVRPRDYILGTNLGMILPFGLFVFLGTTASDVTSILRGDIHLGPEEWIAATVVFIIVTGAILAMIRMANQVLREELKTQQ